MEQQKWDFGTFTLLIVDDSTTNLSVVGNFLREYGMQLLAATDGESGFRRAVLAQPDLILLDVMMPDTDGFTVCARLKKEEKTRDIPVIFMTALADEANKVKGFQAGAVDYITKPIQHGELLARVKTHLRLQALTRNLQAQNKELEAFAHTVAHDLKNPLALVDMAAKILRDTHRISSPDENEAIIQTIIEGSARMQTIIQGLLLLATTRQGEVQLQPMDMTGLVTEVRNRLAPNIQETGATITSSDKWPVVLGHRPWVEEVWVNYISNALKYGGRDDLNPPTPPHIELGFTPETNGFVRFWVRDNGAGISEADQAHLFIPFSRLAQSRSKGHGLGLSIVQRIVERLGGQVGVESAVGVGSLFYFTLPIALPIAGI